MASGSVVVNRDDGIFLGFGHRPNDVGYSFLHFRIGSLYGVQLDGIVVLSGFYRWDCSSTHTDTIVVTTHYHYFFPGYGRAFKCVAHVGESYTAGEHNDFVESKFFTVFGMLECEQGAADEGLSEFVSEIRSSVRGLNQYLFGRLIKPRTRLHGTFFPFPSFFRTRIGRHINCRSGNR